MSHQIMISGTAGSIGLAKGKNAKGAEPQARQAFDQALNSRPRGTAFRAEAAGGENKRPSGQHLPIKETGLRFQIHVLREMEKSPEGKTGEEPPLIDGETLKAAEVLLEFGETAIAMPVDGTLEQDAEGNIRHRNEAALGEAAAHDAESAPGTEENEAPPSTAEGEAAPSIAEDQAAPPTAENQGAQPDDGMPPILVPPLPGNPEGALDKDGDGRAMAGAMPGTVLAPGQPPAPEQSARPAERPRLQGARLLEAAQGLPAAAQRMPATPGRQHPATPLPMGHAARGSDGAQQDGRDRSPANSGNGRVSELLGRVTQQFSTDKPADPFGARVSVVSNQSSPAPVSINAAATPLPGTPAAQIVAAIRADAEPAPRSSTQVAEAKNAQPGRGQPVQTIQIQLHPIELGRVTARMSMVNGQLSVELQVETGRARAQLAGDTDSIVKSLKAAGYDVDRVSVQQGPSPGSTGTATAQERAGAQAGDARSEESERRSGRDGDGRSRQEQGQDANESLAGEPRRGGLYI